MPKIPAKFPICLCDNPNQGWKVVAAVSSLLLLPVLAPAPVPERQLLLLVLGSVSGFSPLFAFLCYGNRSQPVYSRRISTAQYEKEVKEATEKALTCLWKSREFRDMKKKKAFTPLGRNRNSPRKTRGTATKSRFPSVESQSISAHQCPCPRLEFARSLPLRPPPPKPSSCTPTPCDPFP